MKQLTAYTLGIALVSSAFVQAQTFRRIPLPNQSERVTAVHCFSARSCVVATDSSDGGHLYASDGQKITATLVSADSKFAESLGILGTNGFTGFTRIGEQLIAHLRSGGGLVSASKNHLQPSSWSSFKFGPADGRSFGLNQQLGFGVKDGRWVQLSQSYVHESKTAPGPDTPWTAIWSPTSVPTNFAELRRKESALCDTPPGVSWTPRLTQATYVAPDLSVILYPSGARNQRGSDGPGVCISTDGGLRFYGVRFSGLQGELGPLGVYCASNRCFAYGGLDSDPESVYIYFSLDIGKGAASTWAKATLPTLAKDSKFRGIALAPDGKNGWAIGTVEGAEPVVLNTNDGGANWKDVTATVRGFMPEYQPIRLHAVYAYDASHIWIGGEKGFLITSGN